MIGGNPPALLMLDRDGVLIQHVPDYVRSWDDVTAVEGAFTAVAGFQAFGTRVAVVTNQSAIGRGLVDPSFVAEVHGWISSEVARHGGDRDITFHVCPHVPSVGCACRKPAPGLLRVAQSTSGVDPGDSWMVGDHDTDVEAGIAAGCGAVVHVRSDRMRIQPAGASGHFPSLAALYHHVSVTASGGEGA